jgi:hypothetical protein
VTNTLVERLAQLGAVIVPERVGIEGRWTTRVRRLSLAPPQSATTEGPSFEVDDFVWEGMIDAPGPVVGIAVFGSGAGTRWIKSERAAMNPKLSVSLQGWKREPCTMTASAGFHGALSQPTPVEADERPEPSQFIDTEGAVMGRPHLMARVDDFLFTIVLIPGTAVQTGTSGPWRLREDLADALEPELRAMMTYQRHGE